MLPKIYPQKIHNISYKNIDKHVFDIINTLKSHGYTAYLVGGGVRDLLLKKVPKDFDIATSAKPSDIKNLFRNCILIGKRFRLAHIKYDQKIFEVSTFRSGNVTDNKLISTDNEWGTEEEDVLRRDFTINGLFYDTAQENIIDYVNGFEDAKAGIIKTIGSPSVRFTQDPVRMIRLLKFKARFDFNIEKETETALINCKEEIKKSSQARIFEELLRMLSSGKSQPFFNLLQHYGLLKILLPKVSISLDSNPLVYDLLKQADIYVCKHSMERPVLLASLIFPLLHEKLILEKESTHLGIIAEHAKNLVNDIFLPFFHVPRKTKAILISILTNQFRLTPLSSKRKRIKIPKDPFFPLSMQFFKLRCMLDEELLKNYSRWHEYMVNSHKKNYKTRRSNYAYKRKVSKNRPPE